MIYFTGTISREVVSGLDKDGYLWISSRKYKASSQDEAKRFLNRWEITDSKHKK
jgi:hypothetical protein